MIVPDVQCLCKKTVFKSELQSLSQKYSACVRSTALGRKVQKFCQNFIAGFRKLGIVLEVWCLCQMYKYRACVKSTELVSEVQSLCQKLRSISTMRVSEV